MESYDESDAIEGAWRDGLKPDPLLTVSAWADRYRVQRGTELVRVPADQVCHVFHPIAEGQIRGVPWVAPMMVRLWLLDQYDDAELDRKKVAAMFAGFVTRPGPDDVMGEDSAQKDADTK
jgi:capsid protein